MSFFTDRNKTPSYTTCKNCGGDDHDFKSCMERPKAASLFKKVKPKTPAKAVKNKKIVQVKLEQKQHRRWNFDLTLASANDSFVVGGQIQKENENALEQDKPIKSTAGVGYQLLKKMGYEEGKGLRTTQEGILEPLLVTKLPKHMWLDHAIKFIKDNPPQGEPFIDGKDVPNDTKLVQMKETNMGGKSTKSRMFRKQQRPAAEWWNAAASAPEQLST
ncbi:hypothetical protein Bca52824_025337 [Brassica carinata]|uniref:G-patch domain-containing protein n=1 Tax=Brassica carinata TaxID=52824 RepID=A0A8X7SK10_BRACI|nr:hypothetical protein Bca52824_025337 [Brassica carinata]